MGSKVQGFSTSDLGFRIQNPQSLASDPKPEASDQQNLSFKKFSLEG